MARKPLLSQPIIFVSFASADVALATEFKNRLQHIVGNEVNCFLSHKSIEAGENWPAQVESHLNGAACIVLLLSETALDSTWVLFEAGIGRGRGVDVIPVALAGFSVDGKRPPLSFLAGYYRSDGGRSEWCFGAGREGSRADIQQDLCRS